MAQAMDINHVFQERKTAGMALIPGAAVAENAIGQIQKQGTVQTAGIGNDFSVTKSISLAEKVLLTLEEAALLTGIGQINSGKSVMGRTARLFYGMGANVCLKGKS